MDGEEPMGSPSEGVLKFKFNFTQADSASSSSTESTVPRRRRHGNRFSVITEESEEEGLAPTQVDPTLMQPSRILESEKERVSTGFFVFETRIPAPPVSDEIMRVSGVAFPVPVLRQMITDDEPNIPLFCTGSLSSQAGGIGLVSLDEVILERVQRESPVDGDSPQIPPLGIPRSFEIHWMGCWRLVLPQSTDGQKGRSTRPFWHDFRPHAAPVGSSVDSLAKSLH